MGANGATRYGPQFGGTTVHGTSVFQTRSSEDRKDFNVEQAHERTGRLVITHDVINVSDGSRTRSAHESETFNVGDETLRERTVRSVVDHDDLSHEQIMVNEADMDFRIAGVPHSVVKHAQSISVRQLIQKIDNQPDRHALQQDLRKIKHLTRIVQNQNKLFRMWVTSNYVNCARRKPKRSAHRVLSYWNMVSSIARAGISCTETGSIGNSSTIR